MHKTKPEHSHLKQNMPHFNTYMCVCVCVCVCAHIYIYIYIYIYISGKNKIYPQIQIQSLWNTPATFALIKYAEGRKKNMTNLRGQWLLTVCVCVCARARSTCLEIKQNWCFQRDIGQRFHVILRTNN